MNIVLYLTPAQEFLNLPPDVLLWRFMQYYGWVIIGIIFLANFVELWLLNAQEKYAANLKYTLLAIDIPKNNEQSPAAVENLFTYLGGAHSTINWYDKWIDGKFQPAFSFEIVSIDGYTQFIIRTPVDSRNIVESAIYSQYPDAEITEIDDYTEGVPRSFPDPEYDLMGGEFMQQINHMYPIKLYKEFEHQIGPKENVFKDPMASLMDLCSSMIKGEQFWFQLLVVPTGFDWMGEADDEVNKILGKKAKVTGINAFIDSIVKIIGVISEAIYRLWEGIEDKDTEKPPLKMLDLTPLQKKRVEGLHYKISKLGFLAKIRVVYIARKEVFNPKKAFSGFVGFAKQFMALDMNSLKPDMSVTVTSTAYFAKVKRLNYRKGKVLTNYINRSAWAGRSPGIFNIEELATIWHFPIEANVKAPLLQKTPAKKAKPPISLPTEESIIYHNDLESDLAFSMADEGNQKEADKKNTVLDEEAPLASNPTAKSAPPSNLPFG